MPNPARRPPERRIRWGIISTANIGLKRLIPAIQASPHWELVAIASRELAKAEGAAKVHHIPKAYGSYDALINDPTIEAIYNPVPNHLHVPLTLQATRAGKHVLCEKPIAITAAEAEQLRQCPRDRLVLEAFMVRFHPQWHRAREIVKSGEIGELKAISGAFNFYVADPNNVRNRLDIGGGSILDVGCYPMTASRFFFESEPTRAIATIDRDPGFRTDRWAGVMLEYSDGRHLHYTCSTQGAPYQTLQLMGTKGRLEIVTPFTPQPGSATTLIIDDGKTLDRSGVRTETMPHCDQYAEQVEAFALTVINGGTLPYGIDDSILNMRVLDAIYRSEKTGGWAAV